jgi:hypothetical protein
MSTVLDDHITAAVTLIRNKIYIWPDLWLQLYRDGRLDDYENAKRARAAIDAGWSPDQREIISVPSCWTPEV